MDMTCWICWQHSGATLATDNLGGFWLDDRGGMTLAAHDLGGTTLAAYNLDRTTLAAYNLDGTTLDTNSIGGMTAGWVVFTGDRSS